MKYILKYTKNQLILLIKEFKMIKNIKNNEFLDLRFYLTEDMNNMMLELLITQQMLKENKLSKRDRKLLENHKNEVMLQFRKEFQKNNVEQIKKYNELMNK